MENKRRITKILNKNDMKDKKLLIVFKPHEDIFGDERPFSNQRTMLIRPRISEKMRYYNTNGDKIVFVFDKRYKKMLCADLMVGVGHIKSPIFIEKETLAYDNWGWVTPILNDIEIIGVDTETDIIANAIFMKERYPGVNVTVDANCCGGRNEKLHKSALLIMKECGINVINEENDDAKDIYIKHIESKKYLDIWELVTVENEKKIVHNMLVGDGYTNAIIQSIIQNDIIELDIIFKYDEWDINRGFWNDLFDDIRKKYQITISPAKCGDKEITYSHSCSDFNYAIVVFEIIHDALCTLMVN